jgi:hypothetical protein
MGVLLSRGEVEADFIFQGLPVCRPLLTRLAPVARSTVPAALVGAERGLAGSIIGAADRSESGE